MVLEMLRGGVRSSLWGKDNRACWWSATLTRLIGSGECCLGMSKNDTSSIRLPFVDLLLLSSAGLFARGETIELASEFVLDWDGLKAVFRANL